jgi:hypothetical protein
LYNNNNNNNNNIVINKGNNRARNNRFLIGLDNNGFVPPLEYLQVRDRPSTSKRGGDKTKGGDDNDGEGHNGDEKAHSGIDLGSNSGTIDMRTHLVRFPVHHDDGDNDSIDTANKNDQNDQKNPNQKSKTQTPPIATTFDLHTFISWSPAFLISDQFNALDASVMTSPGLPPFFSNHTTSSPSHPSLSKLTISRRTPVGSRDSKAIRARELYYYHTRHIKTIISSIFGPLSQQFPYPDPNQVPSTPPFIQALYPTINTDDGWGNSEKREDEDEDQNSHLLNPFFPPTTPAPTFNSSLSNPDCIPSGISEIGGDGASEIDRILKNSKVVLDKDIGKIQWPIINTMGLNQDIGKTTVTTTTATTSVVLDDEATPTILPTTNSSTTSTNSIAYTYNTTPFVSFPIPKTIDNGFSLTLSPVHTVAIFPHHHRQSHFLSKCLQLANLPPQPKLSTRFGTEINPYTIRMNYLIRSQQDPSHLGHRHYNNGKSNNNPPQLTSGSKKATSTSDHDEYFYSTWHADRLGEGLAFSPNRYTNHIKIIPFIYINNTAVPLLFPDNAKECDDVVRKLEREWEKKIHRNGKGKQPTSSTSSSSSSSSSNLPYPPPIPPLNFPTISNSSLSTIVRNKLHNLPQDNNGSSYYYAREDGGGGKNQFLHPT